MGGTASADRTSSARTSMLVASGEKRDDRMRATDCHMKAVTASFVVTNGTAGLSVMGEEADARDLSFDRLDFGKWKKAHVHFGASHACATAVGLLGLMK